MSDQTTPTAVGNAPVAGDAAAPVKKSAKEMTKAERRALQEAQRAAKAAAKNSPSESANGAPKTKPPAQEKKPEATKPQPTKPASGAAVSTSAAVEARPALRPAAAAPKRGPLDFFEHLRNSSGRPSPTAAIDPTTVQLGLQLSAYCLRGGNNRATALVRCLQSVIEGYKAPEGQSFAVRELSEHLDRQLDYLGRCRPHSQSMKSVVAHLKEEIGRLGRDAEEGNAKKALKDGLEQYLDMRIRKAADALAAKVASRVQNGDRIAVVGSPSAVIAGLVQAKREGKAFEVIAIDSEPLLEGRDAAQLFSRAGISTSYVLVSGMAPFLRSASKCFFGASSVASNGAVLGRAGQGLVAAVAKQLGVPTIVFSESYKRSDSPRLNSLSWNELWTPQKSRQADLLTAPPLSSDSEARKVPITAPLYDVTSSRYISEIVSE